MATTTSKPPQVIKADLRKVLDRMQVRYREIKGGFECIHLPSIDLSSVQNDALTNSRKHDHHHHTQTETSTSTSNGGVGSGLRRSLTKKASKLSFALKSSKESDRSTHTDSSPSHAADKVPAREKEKDSASQKSGPINMTATMSSGSSSFFDVSSNAHTITPETVNQNQNQPRDPQHLHTIDTSRSPSSPLPPASPSTPTSPGKTKNLPPIPRDFGFSSSPRSPSPLHNVVANEAPTGEVGQEVFDTIGSNNLSVRFEITIVKVSSYCLGRFN